MSNSRWITVVVLWILGATLAGAQEPESTGVSPFVEYAHGEYNRDRFLELHPRSTDEELRARVDRVGRAVALFSDRPQLLYEFIVIEGDALQAYSIAGGAVILTEGMAKLYDTDDELAFALGHEIAHIALRHHITRSQVEEAVESGSPAEDQEVVIRTVLGQFGAEQEDEADRYGALYAVRADYEFSAAPEALDKLADGLGDAGGDTAHPEFPIRIDRLRNFKDELLGRLEDFETGKAALREGRCEEAIASFRPFVAQFPSRVSGRVNLGFAYLAKVREDGGRLPELAEVLLLLPDPGVAVRSLGYSTVDLEEARDQFRKALDIDPDNATALTGLALVEVRLGEMEQAAEHMDAALRVEPDDSELLLCGGNVAYLRGDFERARARYDAALDLNSGWPAAKKNLALTYERLEMVDDARALWQQLLGDDTYRRDALRQLELLDDADPG
jgi:predicted Zn-dependent protease